MKKWRIISIVLAIVYPILALCYGAFTVYMVYLDRPLWLIAVWIFNCMCWGGLSHWAIRFALKCRKDRQREIELEKLLNETPFIIERS